MRPTRLAVRLTTWSSTLALLVLAPPISGADQPATIRKPAGATAPSPAGPQPAITNAPAGDPAPDKEKELLKLLQSDSDFTNTLGNVLVHLPAGFRVARTEVTQADFEKVMGSNPSKFTGGSRPVERVTAGQAAEYCRRLTELEQTAGQLSKSFSYALPGESAFDLYVADTPLETACVSYIGDRLETAQVGSLAPNKIGLYDVRGNVWEWCDNGVARGSSYQSHEDYLSTAFRFVGDGSTALEDIGFRIILRGSGKP